VFQTVVNDGRQITKKPGEVGGSVIIGVKVCPASQPQVREIFSTNVYDILLGVLVNRRISLEPVGRKPRANQLPVSSWQNRISSHHNKQIEQEHG